MPIQPYIDCLEPAEDAVIWRFIDMMKFRDLMANEELYFRRADLFSDESEGLPPEEYALPLLGLNPYDLNDQQKLNHQIGSIAQFRESYYISCWHLFRDETLKMWEGHAKDGVAICSQYGLLKSALDGMGDVAHLGLVRYGIKHLTGWNVLRFITTKQMQHAGECEVRAFLDIPDPLASGNRHFDENNRAHRTPLIPPHEWVSEYKRRRVDLKALITGIVVSAWASEEVAEEVKLWVKVKHHSCTVQPSELARHKTFIPTPDEVNTILRFG